MVTLSELRLEEGVVCVRRAHYMHRMQTETEIVHNKCEKVEDAMDKYFAVV